MPPNEPKAGSRQDDPAYGFAMANPYGHGMPCPYGARAYIAMLMFLSAGLLLTPAQTPPAAKSDAPAPASKPVHPFLDNVKVEVTETQLVVRSDGIPDHETAKFPNRDNPNTIQKQEYRFVIPRTPKRAEKPVKLPMGPIGVAVNGIPFYNPYNREGNDAVQGPFAEVFDSCCGHPDQLGRYHYHKYPVCLKSPFRDKPGEHSPLIGYAFDGYAIHGPQGADGKSPTDLDECNGHEDAARGYHYHATEKSPYLLGAYRGEPAPENLDRRGRFVGGREAPPRPGRPPGPPPPPGQKPR